MKVIRAHRPMLQRVGAVSLKRRGGSEPPSGPPVNGVAPSIPTLAVVAADLTVNEGTWSGARPITYTYQWQANGVDIPGATGKTYKPVAGNVGQVLRCNVTATNAEGNATAPSNNSAPVVAGWVRVDGQPWQTEAGASWELEG